MPQWGVWQDGEHVHVAPCDADGQTKHEISPECWCGPRLDWLEVMLYIHFLVQ